MEVSSKRRGEDSGEIDKLKRKRDEDSIEIRVLEQKCGRCESLQSELEKQTARINEVEEVLEKQTARIKELEKVLEKRDALLDEFDCLCERLHTFIAVDMRMELEILFSILKIEKLVYRVKVSAGPGPTHLLMAVHLKRIGFSMDDWDVSLSRKDQDAMASRLSDKQIGLLKRIQSWRDSGGKALPSDQST